MQVGSPGRLANLLFAGVATPIELISCAASKDVSPISSNKPTMIRLFKAHPQEWI